MSYRHLTIQKLAKNDLIDEGRLQIGVYNQGVAKPVNNATVRVTKRGDNLSVIEELITDPSGQTAVINLPCPPIEYSLEPNMPRPFETYDIIIENNGFNSAIINGVQIFPETTAFQSVNLNEEVNNARGSEIINIKEPVLYGTFPPKIPEPSVKSLPESTGFVVLPDPIVPETVVVHNGVPTDTTAKNYYVPFKDYIKNVASSEIYSNWPESTIKANVLAIISFTLNRVYTEWYRSQGFNFTVTNSTAFDQAFNYGRNIFKEISQIVDDIFTTFITKPGIRQPLFTQYCDGVKSTCPNWMQQWGSKDLGDQGYNEVEILRNFYGPDIFLMQAKKVQGIPQSYPGTPLQLGSKGQDVTTIQQQLNTISNNYPLINKVKVDGVYGEQTRIAVETFQEIFKLPSTGIVDFATWYRISFIYVAVAKLAT